MAETATQQAPAPAEAKPELKFPNPIAESTFNQLKTLIEERNKNVASLNAVKGDPHSLLEDLRESSKNSDAVKARELRNKLRDQLFEVEERLDKAVKPEVDEVRKNVEGKAAEIENKIKEADSAIKPGVNFYKKVYENGEEIVKHLPELAKAKGVSTSAGGTSGGRRIRGYDFTVTDPKGKTPGKPTGYENVAQIAKDLVVETKTLQDGFFKAAGTDVLKDAPDNVTWKVQVGEKDQAREVTLTAKRSAEKPAAESSNTAA
jgi:hypothetical protein